MSEWLGKPRFDEKDIEKSNPSLIKYFPMLTKYFVEAPRMRLVTVLPHDKAERFKQAVIKTYGEFAPETLHQAAEAAIDKWIESHS